MDGKLDVQQQHISKNSINNPESDVKVLPALIKVYSKGISLIGAERFCI